MKNAALLLGIWIGIYLFAFSVAHVRSVDVPRVPPPAGAEVVDERNGFAFPRPVGWSVVTADGVARLVAPIAGVEAWALSGAGTTAGEALAEAWEKIEPCSPCELPAVLQSDSLTAGREGAVLALEPDVEGRTNRVVVLLPGTRARVLLIRLADGVSLPARVESDLREIEAGFRAVEPAPAPSAPDSP
jgi:hypothetical protein